MLPRRSRGQALLLEIVIGMCILLAVVLAVVSLFPISYNTSIQAWKIDGAVNLARQVLERQKQFPVLMASPIPRQQFELDQQVQGRELRCLYTYQVDLDSSPGDIPPLWKVTVAWEHSGRMREIYLVGGVGP